jgi:hypothetical protein
VTEKSARVLTRTGISEAIQHLRSFLSYFLDSVPNMNRNLDFAIGVENAANCYKLFYSEKKRAKVQLSLETFFSRTEPGWHPSK